VLTAASGAQLARRIRNLNDRVATGTQKVEAIQELCKKMTAAAPGAGTGLQRRRPHGATDDDGRLLNGNGPADDAVPPPPPARPKSPEAPSAAAEQIQGIWYGWA
jgi:hypothetical protein